MRSLSQLLLTFLLNASWQIAVVSLFAACGSRLLRGTAAWCRHSVWVAAIVISLCLPIISSLNRPKLSPVSTENINHNEPERRGSGAPSLQGIGLIEPGIAAIQQMPVVEPKPLSRWDSPISLNRNLAAVLVAFYGFLLLYRGYKLVRAWRRTTAIMRKAFSTPVSGRAAAIVARCQTAIGVSRARVVCSTSISVPITAGVFSPLVILPARLLDEADEEILLSAIAHELVHVARRDYILNLVYEIIYLPISFHPAAAMLRRRIKQTRELCCDELVASKLMAPELYARSLVRLVGSVPLGGRLASDTTIGINDADILEVRIMSLLRSSKLTARRKTLLLIAAGLLLAAPCVAAAAFALHLDIENPQPATGQQQEPRRESSQKLERAREELQRAREDLQRRGRELEEQIRKNPNAHGADLEALHRKERELEEAAEKLNHEQEAQHMKAAEDSLRQLNEKLAHAMTTHPENEARMREAREKFEQLQRSFPENEARLQALREQLAMIEKQYPDTKLTAEHWQSLRRAQEEMAHQKEALTQEQLEKIGEKLKHEMRLRKEAGEIESKIRGKYDGKIRKEMDKHRKELDEAARKGAWMEPGELTKLATMPMDRAIQIAVSQHPGKVLACHLGRQNGEASYRLVIINGEGEKTSVTHVWVSATDGRIIKTEHE